MQMMVVLWLGVMRDVGYLVYKCEIMRDVESCVVVLVVVVLCDGY